MNLCLSVRSLVSDDEIGNMIIDKL